MITRPLLAGTLKDIKKLQWSQWVTPKLDGIRNLIIDGKAVSRNFKQQPNVFIREWLSSNLSSGLDGELVLKGDKPFNDIQSKVMSFEGEPDFEYWIFDYVKDSVLKPYLARMEDLKAWYKATNAEVKNRVKLILPVEVKNEEELLAFEAKCLAEGYEGVMLRKGDGIYKCNRSTEKEQILLKLKRFNDADCLVIGFEERLHNTNEKEQDAFGHSKRSSHQDNMIPMNTLGALVVQNDMGFFKIGSGFNDQQRKEIWDNQDKYLGQLCTYKYQPPPKGSNDSDLLPRFPIFLRFRVKDY